MASPHLLLLVAALNGLRWTAGLQLYYYRQPIGTNTNSIQSWKVEGLATRIAQSAFSDNLDCNTTSNNGAGISWTGQVPFNPSWVQSLLNGKRLTLDSFNNINFGIYTCYDSATNESLNVNITSANPAIQAVSDVVTIEAGSSGQLKVYISGVPYPTSTDIAWLKVGPGGIKTEIKEPTVNFSSDHRTLLLTNIQDSDEGTYMCIVTQSFSPYPSANVIIQLAINVPTPVIQQPPNNISLQVSSNATLTCIFSGSPNINITWMRADMKLLPPQAQVVTSYNGTTTESTLHIPFIQPSDGGQYRCVATSTRAVVSATAAVMVHAGPDSNTTTITPSSTTDAIRTTRVVIAFVFVIIGTFLIAMCLSLVIILCQLKRRKTKRHSLLLQGIRLQSCTSSPTIEDIDPHDDVFSTGTSVSNTQPKSFPRGQRVSGSTSSSRGLLEAHDTCPSSTKGGARLPAIEEDAPTEPTPSEGARYSLPMEEHTSSAVPHYMLITPRGPTPLPSHHHTPSVNPTVAQYADLMPVPYLTPSLLTITTSASPELDPVGPTIGLSPRPWYENSNSSLRQVGIQDDIQPYATTSNLSIPLDPVAERTWGPPPPRPPSPLPGSQVPLPYMDPAPLRQTLERSSRHRSLSPVMSTGDLV
eukprot:Em0011g167a